MNVARKLLLTGVLAISAAAPALADWTYRGGPKGPPSLSSPDYGNAYAYYGGGPAYGYGRPGYGRPGYGGAYAYGGPDYYGGYAGAPGYYGGY